MASSAPDWQSRGPGRDTATQLALNRVAVSESGLEALEGVGQDCDLDLETLLRWGVRAQAARGLAAVVATAYV